jgi:hypothetical protein
MTKLTSEYLLDWVKTFRVIRQIKRPFRKETLLVTYWAVALLMELYARHRDEMFKVSDYIGYMEGGNRNKYSVIYRRFDTLEKIGLLQKGVKRGFKISDRGMDLIRVLEEGLNRS